MSDNVFYITIIFGFLFGLFFILYGYFSYKVEKDGAKKASYVCLILGILTLGAYIYFIAMSFINPSYVQGMTDGANNGKLPIESSGVSVTGLKGSLNNGQSQTRDYPDDPKAQAILSKGDTLLVQNNIQGAIDQYKVGIKDEKYKDIFKSRIDYAKNIKKDYNHYLEAVNFFSKGKYDKAYDILKRIKPSDLSFYLDIEKKMEQIAAGMIATSPSNENKPKTVSTP